MCEVGVAASSNLIQFMDRRWSREESVRLFGDDLGYRLWKESGGGGNYWEFWHENLSQPHKSIIIRWYDDEIRAER